MHSEIFSYTSFNETDQEAFSFSSGDFNPLHANFEFARRSKTGEVVVHGIHVFIWAIDSLLSRGVLNKESFSQTRIICKFKKPVFLFERITLVQSLENENKTVFFVTKDSSTLVRIEFKREANIVRQETIKNARKYYLGKIFEPLSLIASDNEQQAFELDLRYLDNSYLVNTFPHLYSALGSKTLSHIAALSSAVGMIAPGRHSLFTSFELNILSNIHQKNAILNVKNYHPDFGLLKMEYSGFGMFASLEALALPEPTSPPETKQVYQLLRKQNLRDEKVLIIGGSRGIGAMIAKILSAWGAKVFITYNSGKADADKLSIDANIEIIHFDVSNSDPKSLIKKLPLGISSFFYFATPKIFFRRTQEFHIDKLDLFRMFYIDMFKKIFLELYARNSTLKRIFYPSSTELDNNYTENKEYTQAKLEGEEMCKLLATKINSINFFVPRLPKITTDQTNWVNQNNTSDQDILYLGKLLEECFEI